MYCIVLDTLITKVTGVSGCGLKGLSSCILNNASLHTCYTDFVEKSSEDSSDSSVRSSPKDGAVNFSSQESSDRLSYKNPPDPPSNCCMSGCANCVWIQYAEEMAEYYRDGGEKAVAEIKKIPDPNIVAFLLMEVRNFQKKDG